jgi:putative ABC transport system permease protein
MIRNYIRIAWRNLVRRKAYTAINISGLAIGIAACLLLFTVVRYEMSYDSFHSNNDRIYRIVTQDKLSDNVFYTPGIPFPALDAIRIDFPNITTGALLANYSSQVTVLGKNGNSTNSDKKFIEPSGVFYANPQFFQVFQYKWLAGSPSVLAEPNNTVLTQKMAEKYFGNWKDAVGQYLKLDNAIVSKVSGILQDPPANSDLLLGVISSYESAKKHPELYNYSTDWGNTTSNFQLFMLLPQGVSSQTVQQQLAVFGKKNYHDDGPAVRQNFLQPLSEMHFDNRYGNLGDHVTSKSTLWTLSLIGVFIIIMACINFINLSTAQAVGRSKEVGIRKVLGSNQRQLFWQILGETAIMVIVAVLLAIVIATAFMPSLKHVASIPEKLDLFNWQTAGFIGLIIVAVTILSGSYPSFVVSRFNPSLALKNKMTSATVGGISLRRGLVVLQFAISQILIIGTIVAVSQMNYVQHADLGFNKESVLVLNHNSDSALVSRQLAFKQKILQIPDIQSVSFSSDVPSSDNNWSGNFAVDHKPDEQFNIYRKAGDEDYFKTYGLEVIAGRAFTKSDTMNEIVVNETLVKKLGIKNPNDIVGKEIRSGRGNWKPIVGVVKDFKTNSLREDVKPTMILEARRRYGVTGIKFNTSNIVKTKTAVEAAWNQFFPEYAYTSTFMDESINNFYRQEQQLSLLYKIFAGIAIFISCLGLYGLVSFMAAQRTKEVGIRKVLGASVTNILYLFSKEFTVLIIVAFVIAVPAAWYLMNNWLENFVFRIKIGYGVFALAIIASVLVAWATVGYRSFKAALSNPVKNLRSE